jgi:hypothetical protein
MDNEQLNESKAGFFKKQFQPQKTTNQKIFNIVFGIFLLLLCFYLDSVVFKSEDSILTALFVAFKPFAYLFGFFSMAYFALWFNYREKLLRKIGMVGGALAFLLLFSNVGAARHYLVSLKTHGGNYVTAENGGGGIINANRTQANEWEVFTLLDLNEGELEDGDKVAIKTMNGSFFSAVNGGGDNVFADKRTLLEWETFYIERKTSIPAGKRIGASDFVAFRSVNNYYLTALNGGGAQINAKTKTFGNDQKFLLQRRGEPSAGTLSGPFTATQMILRGVVGLDDSGRTSGDFNLCTNAYFGENFPNCYLKHEGTDFLLAGHLLAQTLGSIDVYTVAGGKVIGVFDGNTDKCFYKPSKPNSKSEDVIFCANDARDGREFISEVSDANSVIIMQDDSIVAYYYHLKKNSTSVVKGQRIECGQLVGKIGSSGISSAPHFHLTLLRVKDTATVPSTDLDFRNIGTNRAVADFINPYKPMLWQELGGVVPKKTCNSYVEGASSTCGLGQPCPNNLCRPGLVMKDGVCKKIGIVLNKPCDGNQLCLPGLQCSGGVCKLPGKP